MGILLGIVGLVIPFAILAGIVVAISRAMGRSERSDGEEAGVSIRRFFIYSLMVGTLVLAASGVSGLIEAAASESGRVARDSTEVARSIAFTLVGAPVFVGLWRHTAKRRSDEAGEGTSLAWILYVTLALLGSLLVAMSSVIGVLTELVDRGTLDRSMLVNGLIAALVWSGHWWIGTPEPKATPLRVHLLLGSAIGLVTLVAGAGTALAAMLWEVYDAVFSVPLVDDGVRSIVRPVIVTGVGVIVWWWYWIRHARGLDRSTPWFVHVLLLGVLGGGITVVVGTGVGLFNILQWFIGDPAAGSAVNHFRSLPGAAAAVAAGAATWWYHDVVLGGRSANDRIEVDRVYEYLLSGAGLLVAAGGLTSLFAVALDAVGARKIASSTSGDAVAVAITLLVIGGPLWWHYWSTIRRHRRSQPEAELRSIARRVYLFALFGVAGVVAVINLVVLVFIISEDLLDGTSGAATISSAAIPIALMATTGTLAWYHFAVFREDRAAAPEPLRPTVEDVVLITTEGDGLEAAIRTTTGAAVRHLRVRPGALSQPDVDGVLDALRRIDHRRVVVARSADGYDIIPIDN